ncbi:MAG: flavin-containing monooxygenase [Solirubrobacteraceae bacterium]
MAGARGLRVVIVGAGLGGIAAAIEFRKHGFDEVQILEKAPALGGTWFYNRYPKCACDVPSHLYSFSFAQRRDWSRICSPREEILRYIQGVAHEHGIAENVVTDTEVSACRWDEDGCRWTVSSSDGRAWEADVLVIATGQLHKPSVPRIQGADRFGGEAFHSSRWPEAFDSRDKRVAVIGTGASGIQFIPSLADQAERVFVYQRTANWFLPRRNRPYPRWVRAAIHYVPGLQAYRRRYIYHYAETLTRMIRNPRTLGRIGHAWSAMFMRLQLKDPDLRRKAWPDYTFGCKRVLFSSHYLPALQRPGVELVTEPISHLTTGAVVTADGVQRKVDAVIYATGFRAREFMLPMEVVGRGGRQLREVWAGAPHAHLGITVPGFPSMFLIYGPNTNTSGGSIILYEEAQAAYIRQAFEHLITRGADAVEVRPEVEAASDREVQARFMGTAWVQCQSWYREGGEGRIVANWPGYMREYQQAVTRIDPSEYDFVFAREREPVEA